MYIALMGGCPLQGARRNLLHGKDNGSAKSLTTFKVSVVLFPTLLVPPLCSLPQIIIVTSMPASGVYVLGEPSDRRLHFNHTAF